jgi:AcrR family transcriptional regulator
MAKKATKTSTKKATTKAAIMSSYTNHVLEHDHEPNSVYKFCKEEKINEAVFYNHFGSLDAIRKSVWNAFHQNTLDVLYKNKDYASYTNREKMLSYYYTFFEVLKLNRSYVLFTLRGHATQNMLKSLEQLKGLRKHIKAFASELIEENNENKQLKITKHNTTIFSEGAWVQFLFILKYWMDDESAGFEKTDVIIEKSVNTVFDVFETTPLESVLDLGKFLWKEKMM